MTDEIKNLVHGFEVAWARHDIEHGGCSDFHAEQLEHAFRKIYDKGVRVAANEYSAAKCAEVRRSLRMLLDSLEHTSDAVARAEKALND